MNGQVNVRYPGDKVSYPTAPQEYAQPKKVHDIRIEKVLRGYFVKVGCQSIAFETAESMCKELLRYYKNPAKVEEEYLATK